VLREPQLLILDEPTNNLDADSVAALLYTLESLKRSTSILVVSHDERILQCADGFYRLDGGILAASIVDSRMTRQDAREGHTARRGVQRVTRLNAVAAHE
jgi:ATPase subunit of ABC transporter with duplicated ATPase domains